MTVYFLQGIHIYIGLIFLCLIFTIFWYYIIFEFFYIDIFISIELRKLLILVLPYIMPKEYCINYLTRICKEWHKHGKDLLSEMDSNPGNFKFFRNLQKARLQGDGIEWMMTYFRRKMADRKYAILIWKAGRENGESSK